jgi:hypothetical protein
MLSSFFCKKKSPLANLEWLWHDTEQYDPTARPTPRRVWLREILRVWREEPKKIKKLGVNPKLKETAGGIMRIRVLDEKIVKAIKKLEGVDIVLKNVEDAQKAVRLILRKTDIAKNKEYEGLKDIVITQVVEHPTSAVEYTIFYEIEFIIADERHTEMEIGLIKELQAMFAKL